MPVPRVLLGPTSLTATLEGHKYLVGKEELQAQVFSGERRTSLDFPPALKFSNIEKELNFKDFFVLSLSFFYPILFFFL